MSSHPWVRELPVAITVMNDKGVVLEMNDRSIATFAADGGAELIGKNGLDCHPEPSRSKLQQLLAQPKANLYTIEKAGMRKLIAQVPWYRSGKYSGIVELAIEIPAEIPHFVRDQSALAP